MTTFAGIAWDPRDPGHPHGRRRRRRPDGLGLPAAAHQRRRPAGLPPRPGRPVRLADHPRHHWWLYPPGIGPPGAIPSWQIEEINHGDLSQAQLEEAHDLDTAEPARRPRSSARDDGPERGGEQLNEDDGRPSSTSGDAAARGLTPPGGEAQTAADAALATGSSAAIAARPTTSARRLRHRRQAERRERRRCSTGWPTRSPTRCGSPARRTTRSSRSSRRSPRRPCRASRRPRPRPTTSASVISVVMVRDLGERRLPAALHVGSVSMFGVCA